MPKLLALLVGAALCAPALPAASARPAALQDPDPVADKRPEVEQLLDELKEHLKARGEEDTEAVAAIEKLSAEFPRSGPKDRDAIVKALDKALGEKRKAEGDEEIPDNAMFRKAAQALGGMGPESVDVLEKWIDHKNHRKDLVLNRDLILALGATRDPDGVDPLVDLLQHHEAILQAAAAEALANYADMDQDVRKHVFEELLKVLMAVKGLVDTNLNDTIARERYDTIYSPITTTLKRVSGQNIDSPNDWQHFWNKNKKEDWDEGRG